MDDSTRLNGAEIDVFAPKEREQLATPALTPISEHGKHEIHSFPDFDASEGQEKEIEHAKAVIAKPDLSVHTNGLVNRPSRHSSTGSPRARKLSSAQLQEFVGSPENLPVRAFNEAEADLPNVHRETRTDLGSVNEMRSAVEGSHGFLEALDADKGHAHLVPELSAISATPGAVSASRPAKEARSVSSPLLHRKHSSSRTSKAKPQLSPLTIENSASLAVANGNLDVSPNSERAPSPAPSLLPMPPLSLPTYLQLELSSSRPSPLYIHRSSASDSPYESSRVKFERLLNFLLLPPNLEQVLCFGAIACLDSWLYTFTILPLRFLKALSILISWLLRNTTKEVHDLAAFVYSGTGRVWQRRRQKPGAARERTSRPGVDRSRNTSATDVAEAHGSRVNGTARPTLPHQQRKSASGFRHHRTKSTPSALLPSHKADILQGMLIIISCILLRSFDASRMYHSIRGQAAIKLYVIYNVLEVFDRLFSALGQDVLECLFSKEMLERNERGRSKIIQPLWMFLLALVYNVIHATALFYQVVTLNVAVNSYNNALLTLLMSNQFVEIKGTVFKKFDKENLFQMTCADVVERFQLWLLLLIIALRNIVEVGGLSISLNSAFGDTSSGTEPFAPNATAIPLTSGFVIPKAFTVFPKWTGEVLGPFLIVLGSEALVDWCKHAYIGKFNNIKPNIYGRFLDVLAKDYYTHAFSDQNLTKRLGLPVIPLSCLVIRACVQTYHMFLATHMPMPLASPATSVSLESDTAATSTSTRAALQHIDEVFRRALGRSSFGAGSDSTSAFSWWSIDDMIAFATMCFFFLALWLVLLAFKLILGMALLSFARKRYRGMKEREQQVVHTEGKRVGRLATVEVGEEKRKWIYGDDLDGLREVREREERGRRRGEMKLDGVQRYSMAAKRIW